jgi:hypothetical protein
VQSLTSQVINAQLYFTASSETVFPFLSPLTTRRDYGRSILTRLHTGLPSLEFELELFLLPTVSRPVSLSIGPPFGTFDQILACSFCVTVTLFCFQCVLTRKRVCSLQCNHSLVWAVTPNNYTLPSHLRLCSLFVASYDSQGLRWKYSNAPPHGVALTAGQVRVTLRLTVSMSWCRAQSRTIDQSLLSP